jgi:methylase of polypeptide subunit release factors
MTVSLEVPLMSPAQPASDNSAHQMIAALHPSEYTAALIQVLRARAAWVRGANALEIGSGSGVVLAALGALGAASLCGIDIESEAVSSSALLLHRLGYRENVEICHGDMWLPVTGRRFDLVTANLPQFPMEARNFTGRWPSWSSGGPDGRRLLDRFLLGLAANLAPSGHAIITHNAFVDLELTRVMIERIGLSLRLAMTVLVQISSEKLTLMTQSVRCSEEGRSIYRYGPYTFAEMHIVEIEAAASLG